MKTRSINFFWLAILQPLWWVAGRALLGSVGWGTFLLVMMFPILLIPMAISLLYILRKDVRQSKHLRQDEARALWFLHLCLFLSGFFFVDFGDSEPSMGSVFTHLLHGDEGLSMGAAAVFGVMGILTALLCLIRGLVRLFRPPVSLPSADGV